MNLSLSTFKPSSNLTLEDFESDLNDTLKIFLTCLYTLTAIFSITGNATAIYVIIIGQRTSPELRIFLVNLSLSDITMALFSIPFTYTSYMLNRWIFHPLFCPFVQFMQLASVIVSVYTLTAIGIDRYFAIMNPFGSTMWIKSRGLITVTLIWMIALSLSSVLLFYGEGSPLQFENTTIILCQEVWPSIFVERVYTIFIFLITFVLPFIILIITYSCIGWKMINHISPGNADAVRDEAQLESRNKVIKMLIVVVILFAICWLPLQVFNILYWFDIQSLFGLYLHNGIYYFCHWMAMANSFLNPIVYCFMSENFRKDLRVLYRGCFRRPRGRESYRRSRYKSRSTSFDNSFKTTTFILKPGLVKKDEEQTNNTKIKLSNDKSNNTSFGVMTRCSFVDID